MNKIQNKINFNFQRTATQTLDFIAIRIRNKNFNRRKKTKFPTEYFLVAKNVFTRSHRLQKVLSGFWFIPKTLFGVKARGEVSIFYQKQ